MKPPVPLIGVIIILASYSCQVPMFVFLKSSGTRNAGDTQCDMHANLFIFIFRSQNCTGSTATEGQKQCSPTLNDMQTIKRSVIHMPEVFAN